MKKSVYISAWSIVLSAVGATILVMCMITCFNAGQTVLAMIVALMLLLMAATALFYMPLSIELTDKHLIVNRPLWYKRIAIDDIADVRYCPPTMGALRLCASGGWLGYWGWFREGDIGTYFAYYGRSSECFLVTLRSGAKYVLGCRGYNDIVTALKARL